MDEGKLGVGDELEQLGTKLIAECCGEGVRRMQDLRDF
jgi:hypothetical protein